MFPVSLQLMEITPDANVTAVLTAVTTYTQSYVAAVSAWLVAYIPVVLPIVGIAVAAFFAIRMVKRFARG